MDLTPEPSEDQQRQRQKRACGARATFWPDVEACEAECHLTRGHVPADIHEDEILGEWSEDELPTIEGGE